MPLKFVVSKVELITMSAFTLVMLSSVRPLVKATTPSCVSTRRAVKHILSFFIRAAKRTVASLFVSTLVDSFSLTEISRKTTVITATKAKANETMIITSRPVRDEGSIASF